MYIAIFFKHYSSYNTGKMPEIIENDAKSYKKHRVKKRKSYALKNSSKYFEIVQPIFTYIENDYVVIVANKVTCALP